jgi:O-antigen/teichoic acid export membrane protein
LKKFIKDVLVLQIGNYNLAFIGFITSVIIARLLHKDNYGIYILVLTLFGLIKDFGFLSAQGAMIRFAKAYHQKIKQAQVEVLSIFITQSLILASLLLIIGIIVVKYLALILYNSLKIGKLTYILLLTLPFLCFYDLALLLCQTLRKMFSYTLFENLCSLIKFIIVILFLVLFKELEVLSVIIALFLHSVITGILSWYLYSKNAKNLQLPYILSLILYAKNIPLKKHFEFIKFSFKITIAKNLVGLFRLLPIILLGKFSVPSQVSYFRIAERVFNLVSLPLQAISKNLAAKFPQSLSQSLPLLKKHFFKSSLFTGLSSLGLFILFILLAPLIINFYGKEYTKAKDLVLIFGIILVVSSFSVGVGPLLRLLNRVDISVKISLISLALSLPFGILLVKTLHSSGACLFLLLLYVIAISLSFLFILRIFKK